MKPLITMIASTLLLSAAAQAATVDTRISTREAYVGVPLTLQITISNFSDYDPPAAPVIDGCDVRSAGAPSQSTQITIINGRRRESRSVALQYFITPRREGSFTSPAMSLKIDGKSVTTQLQRFVATRSETGDLLFVAIEGRQDKVYVGQAIELTLKIWIKPFHDAHTDQTLSEGDMWNLLSDSTSWGGFEAKLKELAQRRQRPGGREVLREDAVGKKGLYYLYEIDATLYPKRAGKIDADDVQIVLNYPTEIGESRSPMGGLFDDDMFGNSPLSQMMRDDFFGSAFGSRLAVTAARPIVGQASVDATDVLPVPSQGRPSDYRGAVGRYHIVTQATPTSVDAGDPITLNIGIVGSGAMELIQAPPLAEMPELTKDFKVADEPLAGFVQDDSKVFSTTIRPRQAGTTEIPAIRFSFFDPETEAFETVASQPIPITVRKADMLALDAIVGPAHSAAVPATQVSSADFTNHSGHDVLISQTPPRPAGAWWWLFITVPPLIWLAAVIVKHYRWFASGMRSLQPPKAQCLAAIERARSANAVRDAVVTYILRRLSSRRPAGSGQAQQADRDTLASAALRTAGLYDLAGETEAWLASAHYTSPEWNSAGAQLASQGAVVAGKHLLKSTAIELVDKLELAIAEKRPSRLRIAQPRSSNKRASRAAGMPHSTLMVLALAGALAAAEAGIASAAEAQDPTIATVPSTDDLAEASAYRTAPATDNAPSMRLTRGQQEVLLSEANAAYAHGLQATGNDSAVAKDSFATAAEKYQLLVDSGISNDKLLVNLGNAYMQGGSLGRAIANYEKARRLAPHNAQVRKNLAFAQAQVVLSPSQSESRSGANSFGSLLSGARFRQAISQWAIPVLCLASVFFWGLLILRTVYDRVAWRGYAAAALLLMVLAGGAVWWSQSAHATQPISMAVIVANKVTLRTGDGAQFGVVATMEQVEGHSVERLNSRGAWTQIRTSDGQVGWLSTRDVEVIR